MNAINRTAEVQAILDSIGEVRAEGARNWTWFYMLAVLTDSQFETLLDELRKRYTKRLTGRPVIKQRVPDHHIGIDTRRGW